MVKGNTLPPSKMPMKKSSDTTSESTPSGSTPKLAFSASSNLTSNSSYGPSGPSVSLTSSSLTGHYNGVVSVSRSSTTSDEVSYNKITTGPQCFTFIGSMYL